MGSSENPLLHGLIFGGPSQNLYSAEAIPETRFTGPAATKLQILPFNLSLRQDSLVLLHIAALAPGKILDAAARGFEGIMNH